MRTITRCACVVGLALATSACTGTTEELDTPAPSATVDVGAPASSESTVAVTSPEAVAPSDGDLAGRTLHVGTDASYPPFESMTSDDEIVGIDPALMKAICAMANCVAEFQNTNWDGIFGALSSGDFDVLMSAITILPEREAESNATFSTPYFEVGQVVIASSDGDVVSSAADLTSGVKVGVQTGTTGDTAATDDLAVAEDDMSRFPTIVLAVEALLNGDVDAVVLDNPTADLYVAQHQGKLLVVGAPFTTEQYGILVPNSAPDVLNALNAAIDELKSSGAIGDIVAEFYSTE